MAPAPHRLAFGDDGSPAADTAWRWVAAHRWPGWVVDVLTATGPVGPTRPPDLAPVTEPWAPSDPRVLGPGRAAAVHHRTAAVDPRTLLGHQHDADLVVVGPRGHGAVGALLLGSTSAWLLRHPPGPVAIVRGADPVRRVLVGTDGSRAAARALDAYLALPWSGDVGVVVVVGSHDRWSDIDRGFLDAEARLARIGVDPQVVRESGQAGPAILRQVDEVDPDLVVLGTRGHTAWERLLVGATASTVARAAPCSVLLSP